MRTNCWWRLSGYVMRHRRDLLLGFGAALAGTVIAVLVPLVTKRVIDDAIAADHRPLAPWAVVLVAAAGATYLLTYVRRYYGGRIAHLVQHDLRMDAFQALLRWDGRQQDRWSSGQLIVRTTNDLQLVQALLFDVPNVLRHVLTLLLGVAVMTWLSVPLALLAVLLVPVIGLIAHRSRRLLAAATHCAQEHKAAVTGVVDAAVCGIRVVKAFGQEERETVKLVTASRALYAAQLRVARLNAHFGPLLQTLPALGQMAVFALGGWMAAQGSITVGTFVAFWACLTLLARPACDLAGMLTIAQQARAGAVRVLELIDSRPTLVDGTKPLSPEARLSLEFQRVSFGYVADRPVLREISLSVRAGETLAVVGAPGSGKSTLASLATRCYDVTQGAVRIGGQDVRELTLDSLRSAIGLVPEDAVLFSGTIGANIAYGRPDATPEQIATAARGGAHRGVRQHSAGRVSDGRRCARTDAVRRATPTHRPGPGATAPAAVVDHGRPDLCRGCGHRMRNSGGAAGGDRGSHRGHFHPPPIHAYLGRPGRGPRLRAPARCRHPRRGVGALSPLSGIAVARAGSRR
ncbi:ABC transporter ATP-binding protein/permease [Mycobacterium tuberculosis]|nr:ABC transporter ATP-binding protein/permease [Mycobacterium tuberculosis]